MRAFFPFVLALAVSACTEDVFTQQTADADPDAPLDAHDEVLGDKRDSAALDAGSSSDGCTPFPPGAFFTCAGKLHINVPYEYCSDYLGTILTPPSCWCQETYNCACIAALYAPDAYACRGPDFPPIGNPRCVDDAGTLYVECIPPDQ